MKHRIYAIASLVVITAGITFAEPLTSASLNRSNLQKMIREAHTPQQYQALASYFRARQTTMEQKAQEEKTEWQRRSDVAAAVAQKYPRPVDSSRYRYEYFAQEADQLGKQASHFESLSSGSSSAAKE